MRAVDINNNGSTSIRRLRKRQAAFAVGDAPRRLTAMNAACYMVIFAGAILILYYGSSVLMPLALAGLLSFVLTPAIRLLKQAGVPKVPAVIAVVVISIAAIGGVGVVVGGQISDLLERIPSYEYNLLKKVSSVRSASVESGVLERARSTLNDLQAELSRSDSGKRSAVPAAPDGTAAVKPIPVEIHQPPEPVLDKTVSLIRPLISPLATTGLIVLFLFFILAQREDLRDRFLRLAGKGDLQRTTVALDDAGDRLSRFFIIQGLLNTSFGVFIGLCLWAMGLPNPVLWGVLAGLMRFVPFIGSVIASVFPIILAAAIDPGWSLVLWTAALFLVSEVMAGEVIEPMLYGRNTGLSPVAVVVATLFWTLLWGPVGLILATPLTVCLMVLGKHVEALRFLEILFGDEPALEPHERLYQRVLAGDGVEAIEVAEQSMKEMPLIRYYDDVALKALSMAYEDASAGRLSADEITEVKDAIDDVVDGLSEHATGVEPAKASDAPSEKSGEDAVRSDVVLCLPVRSELDEGPLLMLEQVLEAQGIHASTLPYNASIRLRALDARRSPAKVVVFGYLGSKKAPAFMGILMRRARSVMPDAIIVAGFWSLVSNSAQAEEWREAVGADRVVTKISDALVLCEELLERTGGRSGAIADSEPPRTDIVYENSMRFGEELGPSA
ncbi:AI-2E family transporter [Hyphomicrobium facile]|uniref:Predicted PurR-regulated permease PerM n=1 Tax=Hyphomicrobium facile TaxID=51670 RepID=A0A1I7MUJ1_9HYPH|nr:AI-2E family transporter [Hyphomicrobium facile]SFV26061.1 Predicted PurR-regulated permease PerM [Hyphomicrobium facile]